MIAVKVSKPIFVQFITKNKLAKFCEQVIDKLSMVIAMNVETCRLQHSVLGRLRMSC
jgi:hypothetical protein